MWWYGETFFLRYMLDDFADLTQYENIVSDVLCVCMLRAYLFFGRRADA